jgi:hypothetical protein
LATSNRAATPDTFFRAASVSKPFPTLAILQLVRYGKLSLDDPLRKDVVPNRLAENGVILANGERPPLRFTLNQHSGCRRIARHFGHAPIFHSNQLEEINLAKTNPRLFFFSCYLLIRRL